MNYHREAQALKALALILLGVALIVQALIILVAP